MDISNIVNKIRSEKQINNEELEFLVSYNKFNLDDFIKRLEILYNLRLPLSKEESIKLLCFRVDNSIDISGILDKNWLENKSISVISNENKYLKLENINKSEEIKEKDEEIQKYKNYIFELENRIKLINNKYLDRENENSFFIDSNVMKRMESEHVKMSNLTENLYGDLVKIWFKMVKEKIKDDCISE